MYFLVHNEWLIQKIKMTSLYIQSLLYKLFRFIIIIYYYYNLFVYFIYKNHPLLFNNIIYNSFISYITPIHLRMHIENE